MSPYFASVIIEGQSGKTESGKTEIDTGGDVQCQL